MSLDVYQKTFHFADEFFHTRSKANKSQVLALG